MRSIDARWLLAVLTIASVMTLAPVAAQVPPAAEVQNPEREGSSADTLKPGANSFAESQARALLQAQGYAQVSALMNDRQGIWHGTAVKNGRKVNVSVDFQGRIAEH